MGTLHSVYYRYTFKSLIRSQKTATVLHIFGEHKLHQNYAASDHRINRSSKVLAKVFKRIALCLMIMIDLCIYARKTPDGFLGGRVELQAEYIRNSIIVSIYTFVVRFRETDHIALIP
ncbi:hypothetical protein D3C71_1604080 [compost metagenome]